MCWANRYIDSLKDLLKSIDNNLAPGHVIFVKEFTLADPLEDIDIFGVPKNFKEIDRLIISLSYYRRFTHTYDLAGREVTIAVYQSWDLIESRRQI